MNHPIVRHGFTVVEVNGKQIPVRIMLVKYDDVIETYYQEEGCAFEFAYGCASFEGFKECMKMAIRNARMWGLHDARMWGVCDE